MQIFENDNDIKNSEAKKVFVTGGTGLIGSHLISKLTKEGYDVTALYRTDIPDFKGKYSIKWLRGDVLDVPLLHDVMEGVADVYHCAAIVSYNPKQKHEMFKINVEGTANIVNAALNAGVRKLCYVSSVAALGKGNKGEIVTEKTGWSEETNDSNYGKSKYFAELEVWRGIGEGLQSVIVNPSIVLGASDWNNSSTKIFKTAYQEFPWYSEGVTGFVDVNDVAKAMIQLMQSEVSGERFILSAENKTFKDVFTAIAKSFEKNPPHKKVSAFLAGAVRRFEEVKSLFTGAEPLLTKETAEAALASVMFDSSKIKKALPGFSFTSIDETIPRVCKELKGRYKL